MVHRVHISGIESGDHGVKAGSLLRGERAISHCDVSVRKGVAVKRRVGLQIVSRSKVSGIGVGPLLLQRNPEKRNSPDFRAHDIQKSVNIRALLNVICQMEVNVIDFRLFRSGLCPCQSAAEQQEHGAK